MTEAGMLKKPALIVWDQFRAHRTNPVIQKMAQLKTKVAVIPGGLTSQMQPLDVSLNKPFKAFIREEWNKWMLSEDFEVTPTGRRKRPSITQVCEWVKRSWDAVNEEIVVKAFKKCGISNALDGTEDDMLYEESVGDLEEAVDDVAMIEDNDTSDDSDDSDDFLGFENNE